MFMNVLAIFLLIYFITSTIYAILVFKNVYSDSKSFFLNILFGPIALIYNLYSFLRKKEERTF